MKSSLPTDRDIEELIAFLPRLYAEGFKPIKKWRGGQEDKDGVTTFPWPEYEATVEEFFSLAAKECWCDNEYQSSKASKMLGDEQVVKTASLDQVKKMITFCVRGERFCDGHWATMIEVGRIRDLLERLQQIQTRKLQNPGSPIQPIDRKQE